MKLFLSFTALGRLFLAGKVTEQDLAEGLFFLGCARLHIFGDETHPLRLDAETVWGGDSACSELVATCHRDGLDPAPVVATIQAAILKAEKEGRVEWRLRGPDVDYDQATVYDRRAFRELIERQGLPLIVEDYEYLRVSTYPGVEEMLREAAAHIECVWR